jgi:hypothetical protein
MPPGAPACLALTLLSSSCLWAALLLDVRRRSAESARLSRIRDNVARD